MPTVKQHLAAIRQLFDYLTTGGIQSGWSVSPTPGTAFIVIGRELFSACCAIL
jgi:hypothetical protein